MLDASVRTYDSTMWGSASLSGTAGSLPGVLDACLKDGFGSVTVDTLVVASNVATATVSGGHHLTMMDSTGPVVRIENASPSGLNGDWRVTVTSSTQFTFTTTGITDQTATTGSTITAKRAPAGFSKPYSATNKAVYRADDVTGTRHYLRIDDTPAQYPTLIAYETMSDVDTGTGQSVGNQWFCKSYEANSTAKAWRLVADSSAFYLLVANYSGSTPYYGAMYYGDIVPILSSDAFHSLLIGHYNNSGFGDTNLMGLGSNNRTGSIARSYTQLGSAIVTSRESHARVLGMIGNQSSPAVYPNVAGNQFLCAPVEVWQSNESILRGWMPGLYSPLHPGSALNDGILITSTVGGGITGRTLQVTRIGNNALALDLTGPWR